MFQIKKDIHKKSANLQDITYMFEKRLTYNVHIYILYEPSFVHLRSSNEKTNKCMHLQIPCETMRATVHIGGSGGIQGVLPS